jgi:hypothetical protein
MDELLILAARAAGYPPEWRGSIMVGTDDGAGRPWNPLTDDGDALRLAMNLKLSIMYGSPGCVQVSANDGGGDCTAFALEDLGGDPFNFAATRRAIVRAAAALAPQEAD